MLNMPKSATVNNYTDWQRMMVKCSARTVLGMLNQAAQKFIVALEKNYNGFGVGARAPPVPLLWIRPWA